MVDGIAAVCQGEAYNTGSPGPSELATFLFDVLHGWKVCATLMRCAAWWFVPVWPCPGAALGARGHFKRIREAVDLVGVLLTFVMGVWLVPACGVPWVEGFWQTISHQFAKGQLPMQGRPDHQNMQCFHLAYFTGGKCVQH